MHKNSILIVGGSGYIGGCITDILKKEYSDMEYTVYDSLVYEDSYRKDVEFVYGDIRDKDKLSKYIDKSNIIIWLAALVGDGACAIDPPLTKEINTTSVKWLVDKLKNNKEKRIIFTSTCSVYGAQKGELDENSPIKPLSIYASTKYEAEQYIINNHKNSLIFRLGTVFGVGDIFSRIRFDLVVNILTLRACVENKLTVFGGDQFRPLIHVYDVANTICKNITPYHVFPSNGIYNLSSQNVRIVDLAYQVRNHFPDCNLEITEMQFEDSRNYRVTSNKIVNELNFKPSKSIDYGICQIRELIQEGRIKDVKDIRYSNQSYLQKNLK